MEIVKPLDKIRTVVKNISLLGVVLVFFFLGMRFILRLAGAEESNIFTVTIYAVAAALKVPFLGIFPNLRLYEDASIDFVSLFSIFGYWATFAVIYVAFEIVTRTFIRLRNIDNNYSQMERG